MKPVAKPAESNTLDSFLEPEAPGLCIVDRTELERSAECPAQAAAHATGKNKCASSIAAAGNEVHLALSKALTDYLDMQGGINVGELADTLTGHLNASRPDVQPEAIDACRASIYAWAKFISTVSPANVLRYDGGRGDKSGQLAYDWPDLGIRVTSEVDLLLSKGRELLVEYDYKAGNKLWTTADVEAAFQFALHAFLVFKTFEEPQALLVRIWNTRSNKVTWSAEFLRKDLPAIERRVRSAAEAWRKWRDKPEKAPAFPTIQKCSICDAAAFCPATNFDIQEFAKDRETAIDSLVAMEAKVDALKKLAGAWVDKNQRDIVTAAGNCFGVGKPASTRKPTKALYSVKSDGDA